MPVQSIKIYNSKGAPLTDGGKCRLCGVPFLASRSKNQKEPKEFCSRKHKNQYGSISRTWGRKLLAIEMTVDEREAILRSLAEAGPGKIAVIVEGLREFRKKRKEIVDLGSLTMQERLGVLCAAAVKMNVIRQS